jgi:hypothetical protein
LRTMLTTFFRSKSQYVYYISLCHAFITSPTQNPLFLLSSISTYLL